MVNPITQPYNHMWYLFALFFWRLTAKWMAKIPGNWIWTGVLAAVLSFTPVMEWELVSRLFLFWPFFLLGLQMGEKDIQKVKKLPHLLCGFVLFGMLVLSILILKVFDCSTYRLCFIGRTFPIGRSGVLALCKLALRYLTALGLGACVLNLVPGGRIKITDLGQNTMSIYLLHALPKLRNTMNALNPMMENCWFSMVYCALWTVGAMVVFGNRWVSGGVQWILELPEKIHKKFSNAR